jgi:hypothetical protein
MTSATTLGAGCLVDEELGLVAEVLGLGVEHDPAQASPACVPPGSRTQTTSVPWERKASARKRIWSTCPPRRRLRM